MGPMSSSGSAWIFRARPSSTSSGRAYSQWYRQMIWLCSLDAELAELGGAHAVPTRTRDLIARRSSMAA